MRVLCLLGPEWLSRHALLHIDRHDVVRTFVIWSKPSIATFTIDKMSCPFAPGDSNHSRTDYHWVI